MLEAGSGIAIREAPPCGRGVVVVVTILELSGQFLYPESWKKGGGRLRRKNIPYETCQEQEEHRWL